MVPPSQTGLFAEAVGDGSAFTTTTTCPVPVQPLASVTVTLYVPDIPVVAAAETVGF